MKESKMEKEEGEAERRVKGKGRKEAKRLWIKCLGGGPQSRRPKCFYGIKLAASRRQADSETAAIGLE